MDPTNTWDFSVPIIQFAFTWHWPGLYKGKAELPYKHTAPKTDEGKDRNLHDCSNRLNGSLYKTIILYRNISHMYYTNMRV